MNILKSPRRKVTSTARRRKQLSLFSFFNVTIKWKTSWNTKSVFLIYTYIHCTRIWYYTFTFCLFDIIYLPSGELKLSYTVDDMKKRLTDQPNRVLFNTIHYYHYMQVLRGMKLKVNRYCIFYTMGTIKYGLIKYKRVFVLCYNCLIDFKWVNVIYALCIYTHAHTGKPRYIPKAFYLPTYLLFLRCRVLYLHIFWLFFKHLSRRWR